MYRQTSDLTLPVNQPADYDDKNVPGLDAVPCFGFRTAVLTVPGIAGTSIYDTAFLSIAEVFLDGSAEVVSHPLPLGIVAPSYSGGPTRTRRFVVPLSGVGSFLRVRAWYYFTNAPSNDLSGVTLSMARHQAIIEPDSSGGDIGSFSGSSVTVLSLSNIVGAKKLAAVVKNLDGSDAVPALFYLFVNAGRSTQKDFALVSTTYSLGSVAAGATAYGVSGDLPYDAAVMSFNPSPNTIDGVEAAAYVVSGA